MKNYGFIEKVPSDEDIILGVAYPPAPIKVLQASRDWSMYLPLKEYQYNSKFDTYGCVSFSAINNIEMLLHRCFNVKTNWSDRHLTVLSETKPFGGNYFDKVANTVQKVGLVEEEAYPFTKDMTQIEYYATVPEDKVALGKEFLKKYTVKWGWVDWGGCDPLVLWENLQYGPLQASVFAWGTPVNGVYQRDMTKETNHAITIFGGILLKEFYIFDHYDGVVKRLAWDFYFGSAIRFFIESNMQRLVKGDSRPEVYAVGQDGVARHIAGELSFSEGTKAGLWAEWQSWETLPQAEVDAMPKGHAFGFIL